jgi:hypothetical protein
MHERVAHLLTVTAWVERGTEAVLAQPLIELSGRRPL